MDGDITECDESIEVRFVKSWPEDEIVALYRAGDWWKDHYDPEGLRPMMEGSFAFVVAVDGNTGRAVGMGRLVSDGFSDAYVQDLVVLAEHRGKGIGRQILKALVGRCIEKKIQWIGLVAEEGTEDFNSPLGFSILPGRPMVFLPGDE